MNDPEQRVFSSPDHRRITAVMLSAMAFLFWQLGMEGE